MYYNNFKNIYYLYICEVLLQLYIPIHHERLTFFYHEKYKVTNSENIAFQNISGFINLFLRKKERNSEISLSDVS